MSKGSTLAPVAALPFADGQQELLDTIDALRQDVLSGKIVAFAAVGLSTDDQTFAFTSASRSVSRLRLMGAVAHLQACMHAGEA